ncbi:MAG TPA: hypothetical protein VGJ57_00475 [Nitrospirales bacterium]|jgi:predicted secreted protein
MKTLIANGYFFEGFAPVQMLVEMALITGAFILFSHLLRRCFCPNKFFQGTGLLLVAIAYLKYRVYPPMPFSVLAIYTTIIASGIFVWVSATERSWKDFCQPILGVLDGDTLRTRIFRAMIVLALPCLVAGITYYSIRWNYVKDDADAELTGLRTVMPAPPKSITVYPPEAPDTRR